MNADLYYKMREFTTIAQELYNNGEISSKQYEDYRAFLINQFEDIEVFYNSLCKGTNHPNSYFNLNNKGTTL